MESRISCSGWPATSANLRPPAHTSSSCPYKVAPMQYTPGHLWPVPTTSPAISVKKPRYKAPQNTPGPHPICLQLSHQGTPCTEHPGMPWPVPASPPAIPPRQPWHRVSWGHLVICRSSHPARALPDTLPRNIFPCPHPLQLQQSHQSSTCTECLETPNTQPLQLQPVSQSCQVHTVYTGGIPTQGHSFKAWRHSCFI